MDEIILCVAIVIVLLLSKLNDLRKNPRLYLSLKKE